MLYLLNKVVKLNTLNITHITVNLCKIKCKVLVDPTSLSRYEWRYWDMYRVPEPGTVSFNHRTYVASFTLESGREIIGELDLTRGLNGNIKVGTGGSNEFPGGGPWTEKN